MNPLNECRPDLATEETVQDAKPSLELDQNPGAEAVSTETQSGLLEGLLWVFGAII